MKWFVGSGQNKLDHVCRHAFLNSYGLSHASLDRICNAVKLGNLNVEENFYKDNKNFAQSTTESGISDKLLKKYSVEHGIDLTIQQLAALKIPNNQENLDAYGFLDAYFNLMGDQQPNRNDEIHLEPCTVKSIYEEYVNDMKLFYSEKNSWLTYSAFGKFWHEYFPNVRIREFKAVSGKCNVCGKLSELRKTTMSRCAKEKLTTLHAYHRSAYMGERLQYSIRRSHALNFSKECLSIITDGMAQSHCELPHFGQIASTSNKFSQHLQGVLLHGRGMIVYRTFNTITNGANLQIHTMLLTLERIKALEGRVPDIFYYQIDGGSENVAKSVIAVCEALVSRNIVRKIVLSRLIVGHTHEDIDGKFGVVWTYIRNKTLLTPQQYEMALKKCLKKQNSDNFIEIIDLYTVPNYKTHFDEYSDLKFSRYCKEEQTQHQFFFEQIPISDDFPLGVKTTYRAYAAENVIEIVEDLKVDVKLRAVNVRVNTYPTAESNGTKVGGMYVLQEYPTSKNLPFAFPKP